MAGQKKKKNAFDSMQKTLYQNVLIHNFSKNAVSVHGIKSPSFL